MTNRQKNLSISDKDNQSLEQCDPTFAQHFPVLTIEWNPLRDNQTARLVDFPYPRVKARDDHHPQQLI
jgi:hypothetical protein